MPPIGKAGTVTPEEFEALLEYSNTFGEKVLATKVAKICAKKAEKLLHEFPNGAVGKAYKSVSDRIYGVVGNNTAAISRDAYSELTGMVDTYGPEVVVLKLSKIASRHAKSMGSAAGAAPLKATATSLKALFA